MLHKIATPFQLWNFKIGEDDGNDRRVIILAVTFHEGIADDAGE